MTIADTQFKVSANDGHQLGEQFCQKLFASKNGQKLIFTHFWREIISNNIVLLVNAHLLHLIGIAYLQ